MVALVDVSKVNTLYTELRQIEQALTVFGSGGGIVAMTVGKAVQEPGVAPTLPVSVSTVGIDYPAQMVDAIRDALTARVAAINGELQELGVTDLGGV